MDTSKTGRTVYPRIGVWYRPNTGNIHVSIEGQGFSTVDPDPVRKRGNPHLFRKLALALKAAGAEHPSVEDMGEEE
jgi:hypothetical protein